MKENWHQRKLGYSGVLERRSKPTTTFLSNWILTKSVNASQETQSLSTLWQQHKKAAGMPLLARNAVGHPRNLLVAWNLQPVPRRADNRAHALTQGTLTYLVKDKCLPVHTGWRAIPCDGRSVQRLFLTSVTQKHCSKHCHQSYDEKLRTPWNARHLHQWQWPSVGLSWVLTACTRLWICLGQVLTLSQPWLNTKRRVSKLIVINRDVLEATMISTRLNNRSNTCR